MLLYPKSSYIPLPEELEVNFQLSFQILCRARQINSLFRFQIKPETKKGEFNHVK